MWFGRVVVILGYMVWVVWYSGNSSRVVYVGEVVVYLKVFGSFCKWSLEVSWREG